MRLVRTVTVLILLVALPAISWYYMNQGANWRIAGWEAMSNKIPLTLPEKNLFDVKGDMVGIDSNFIIATNVTTSENIDFLDKLAGQFRHRKDLLLLSFGNPNIVLDESWVVVDCEKSPCISWSDQLFLDNSNVALIDDSLYIRNTYDMHDDEQVNELIEHAVILFPVEKHKKIELKRGND